MKFSLQIIGIFLMVFLFSSPTWGQAIADVNGVAVTEAEFANWVKKTFRIGYRLNILQNKNLKRHMLQMYCYEKALLDETAKLGVYIKDEEVDQEVERLKENFAKKVKDKIPFSRLLMERNITLEGLKGRIRYMMSVRKAVEKDVNEKKLREYFKEYRRHFGGELVKARHLLILTINKLTKKPLSDFMKQKALDRIKDLRKKIAADGTNFAKLAKENSESPNAKDGGDLGYFPIKGRLPRNFTEVAYKLKVGQVSEVVETSYGYHLILVTDHIKPKPVEYELVQDRVKAEYIRDKVEEFINSVKQNTRINFHQ